MFKKGKIVNAILLNIIFFENEKGEEIQSYPLNSINKHNIAKLYYEVDGEKSNRAIEIFYIDKKDNLKNDLEDFFGKDVGDVYETEFQIFEKDEIESFFYKGKEFNIQNKGYYTRSIVEMADSIKDKKIIEEAGYKTSWYNLHKIEKAKIQNPDCSLEDLNLRKTDDGRDL